MTKSSSSKTECRGKSIEALCGREKKAADDNSRQPLMMVWFCYVQTPYYTLISTSTPLGSSSFIRASTVLAVEL